MKTVLISGAATGFGRCVALGLAKNGHRVIAGCQIWPQVTELRELAHKQGVVLEVIKLDVLSQIDRMNALKYDVDVLFNNAGIMESGPVIELPMQIVRSVFETNVFAALELAQEFAKKMVKKNSGKIVWISSVAGLVKVPWDGAYSASKFAVEAFCAAMREELEPYGVKVCTINPGAYKTGFNDTGMESQDQWWGLENRTIKHWPPRELNNQHDPQEMVDAMIEVISSNSHNYRTVKPESAVEMIKQEQSIEWERKI